MSPGVADTCLSSCLAALRGNPLHFQILERREQDSSQGCCQSLHRWLCPLYKGPHQGHPKICLCGPREGPHLAASANLQRQERRREALSPGPRRSPRLNFRRWRKSASKQKWTPEPPPTSSSCPWLPTLRGTERRSERDQLSHESFLKAMGFGGLTCLEGSVNPLPTPHFTGQGGSVGSGKPPRSPSTEGVQTRLPASKYSALPPNGASR